MHKKSFFVKFCEMEKIPFGKFGFIQKEALEWIRRHLLSFMGITGFVIAMAFWSVHQWSMRGSPADYLSAEVAFNEWTGDRSEHFIKLHKLLKQHPELHAKYDGRIAQKLLLSSQQGLAASFSKATHTRIGSLSPYYKQFSNCSLLIGEKKLQEALLQSQQLKQMLDEDDQFWQTKSEIVKHGAVLYGYNLLRIAFLEQALGNAQGELEAWQEFRRNSTKQLDPEAYHLIGQNFQKNDISLQDFIEHREEALSKTHIR